MPLRFIAKHSLRAPIILRYLVAGGFAAAINLGVLYVLADIFHIWYLFASFVAFVTALVVSFIGHKFFTFHHTNHPMWKRQFGSYTLLTSINIALNVALMYLLVDKVNFHHMPAQIISSGTIAIESFFMYRYVIFKHQIRTEEVLEAAEIQQ